MNGTRLLAASIAASLFFVSAASHAVVGNYAINDDAEFTFLDIGPIAAPGALSGTAVINDVGNGTPTLVSLTMKVKWTSTLTGAAIDAETGVAGSSVAIDFDTTIGPLPNQTGNGQVALSVNWGNLVGWGQAGTLSCVSTCPGGCITDACVTAFGVGTPLPPLTSSVYNLDPWAFSGGGTTFTGPIGTTFWLIPGSILFQGKLSLSGVKVVIPALGAWGASALVGALLFAGYRQMIRKRS